MHAPRAKRRRGTEVFEFSSPTSYYDLAADDPHIADTSAELNLPGRHDYLPPADIPFSGGFRGCTWNGQALFAKKCYRHHPKMRQAIRLANLHDFTLFQETHSSKGKASALHLPRHLTALWSDGTNYQAGVGILVQHSFLQHFNLVTPASWEEVEPGRVAITLGRRAGSTGHCGIVFAYR